MRHAQRYVSGTPLACQYHAYLFLSPLSHFLPIAPMITYLSCSTHRQRTQNYIKTLESEVVRLRESETNLMQERDKLRSQIDNLRTTIVESKIPLPEGVEDIGPPCAPPPPPLFDLDMPATVSYSNDGLDHPRLHVNFPQHQEPSSQGLDFSTQTYPLATPYQGHQQYTNVPQSAPDLPNGWWSIPYRLNMSG